MFLGLLKKYCAVCGKEVSKEEVVVRFGERFCSEKHAEEYKKEEAKEKAESGGGGCCAQ